MASSLCCAEAALWQNCGEDDAKMLGRMDPVLKCYPNCPQMITFNQDVLKGEADGSRTFLQQVVLKPHEQAANVFIQSSGATVKAVTSQVEYMLLNHSNEKVDHRLRMKPKSTLSWQTCHSLGSTQQQTNA
jgi:hypothetical protein